MKPKRAIHLLSEEGCLVRNSVAMNPEEDPIVEGEEDDADGYESVGGKKQQQSPPQQTGKRFPSIMVTTVNKGQIH